MITQLLISAIAGLASWVASLFGTIPTPSWLTGLPSTIATLGAYAAGFGSWFPVGAALAVAAAYMACLALALGVRVVRIVASFLTAGGGSAA